MAVRKIAHPSVDDRKAMGLEARDRAPLSSHTEWRPASDRPDPVALLEEQDATREPDLVPVRHGRMMVSPFTFYRGAAKIMAADLADTPVAGLEAQLCGDAHLSNFGLFASPERILLFDVNDFDETLPGPFEFDVKRMAASFAIAGRNNGFAKADTREATLASVRAYREAMASFAQMGTMDIWYAHLDEDELRASISSAVAGTATQEKKARKQEKADKRAKAPKKQEKQAAKRRRRTGRRRRRRRRRSGRTRPWRRRIPATACRRCPSSASWSTGSTGSSASRRSSSRRATWPPPTACPRTRSSRGSTSSSAPTGPPCKTTGANCWSVSRSWTWPARWSALAASAPGTSSFCSQGRDAQDPLFLQIKEATASVLEGHLRKSRYRQHGERVVQGQRMMQAASDIYLGWTKGPDARRHFYWRQLRDMKGSVDVEKATPLGLTVYARTCGWTLARAHARSGDPIAIAEYLGDSDTFDKSVTDFSERYADQNEQDYQQFVNAIRSGKLEAVEGVSG